MRDFITTYRNEHFDGLLAFYQEKGINVSMGDSAIFAAYHFTNDHELDAFTVERMPFEQDMGEFMYAMEEAGIQEFTLCDESTGLMRSLHYLLATGWEIVEAVVVTLTYGTQRGLIMRKK